MRNIWLWRMQEVEVPTGYDGLQVEYDRVPRKHLHKLMEFWRFQYEQGTVSPLLLTAVLEQIYTQATTV